MNLKGIYTVKSNSNIIAKSTNQVQQDGFKLIQNWFASNDNNDIKRIYRFEGQNINFNIIADGIDKNDFTTIGDVFNGYNNAMSAKTTNNISNTYYEVNFLQGNENIQRKIKAIGIDIVYLDNSASQYNSNLSIKYKTNASDETMMQYENFVMPVYKKSTNYNKSLEGSIETIYYLPETLEINTLRIQFNKYHSSQINYRIYGIYLYEENKQYLPPTHMTLYDQNDNVIITKEIETAYPNIEYGFSSVFKTMLEYDELDSSQHVYAVSTDFYQDGIRKMFSKSYYDVPWSQEQFTTIELQYELFYYNENASSSSNNSNNSLS